ncbi:DUF5994 family protein [Mycobacterium sp. MMS18-G62]
MGADIDGAWWPHTGSVARELPDLIGVLHKQLGEIIDICVNWSDTEAAVDLSSLVTGARWQPGVQRRRYRLMVVLGRDASAKLLVIPHMTPQTLGLMVMRCAAARPVSAAERDSQLFETADSVLRAAQDESALWSSARVHDLDAVGSVVAPVSEEAKPLQKRR